MASLNPRSGLLGKKLAAHLLRRTTLGPSADEIESFAGKTAEEAINELLQLPSPPAAPLDPETGATGMRENFVTFLLENPNKKNKTV